MQDVDLSAVPVQVELYVGEVGEGHEADAAGQPAAGGRSAVHDRQHLHHVGDEPRHAVELGRADAAGRVQNEHHVRTVRTRCHAEQGQ